jgi:hypothetical protein
MEKREKAKAENENNQGQQNERQESHEGGQQEQAKKEQGDNEGDSTELTPQERSLLKTLEHELRYMSTLKVNDGNRQSPQTTAARLSASTSRISSTPTTGCPVAQT